MLNLKDGTLWQWDVGRKMVITLKEGSTIDKVQFYNGMEDYARPATSIETIDGEILAGIPNTLLQHPNNLTAYLMTIDEDGVKTTESITMAVNKRAKPEDYVYSEEDYRTYKVVLDAFDDLRDEFGELKEDFNGLEGEFDDLRNDFANFTKEVNEDVEECRRVTEETVREWMDEHREEIESATVQDGTLTIEKFSDDLKYQTLNSYVTPEMFGAKGDGTTDDSTAIQNAINYAIEHSIPFVDKGKHLITKTVKFPFAEKPMPEMLLGATYTYTGNSIAFEFDGVYASKVTIRQVIAKNGTALLFRPDFNFYEGAVPGVAYNTFTIQDIDAKTAIFFETSVAPVQCNNFILGTIKASNKCICVTIESDGNSFRYNNFYGGRITGQTAVGVSVENNYEASGDKCDANCFNGTVFADLSKGVILQHTGRWVLDVNMERITNEYLVIKGHCASNYFKPHCLELKDLNSKINVVEMATTGNGSTTRLTKLILEPELFTSYGNQSNIAKVIIDFNGKKTYKMDRTETLNMTQYKDEVNLTLSETFPYIYTYFYNLNGNIVLDNEYYGDSSPDEIVFRTSGTYTTGERKIKTSEGVTVLDLSSTSHNNKYFTLRKTYNYPSTYPWLKAGESSVSN